MIQATLLPTQEKTCLQTDPKSSDTNTRYLNGLRGIAALLVYLHHHAFHSHACQNGPAIFANAFGYDGKYYISTFPIIRLFFSGGPVAVSIFFVISGYVLALQPLRALHSHDSEKLLRHIGSGIFRRWTRLFLPVAITTFIWAMSWHIFDIMPANRANTIRLEATQWATNFLRYSFLFKDVPNAYNEHTWSIAFEFRGSMVIYTSLLAFRHLTTAFRILAQALLTSYFLWLVDGPYYACFTAGLLLADIDTQHLSTQVPPTICRLTSYLIIPLFLLALHLAGVPTHQPEDISYLRSSPGWYILSYLTPSNYSVFYHFWSAVLLIVTIPRLPVIRKILESKGCQYLGRISYSLYLVHGPILWSLGDAVYGALGCIDGQGGIFGLERRVLLAQCVLLLGTIGVAEVCTRVVDGNSVRFSKWLGRRGRIGGGG
ncbi:O-acetyltransferase PaAT-1 [Fulvia fulva]|uniref:O-acetyltransferase PaAT-1 n=1 Tax=Passalora fulva TaxID=5499 RepID=A0A9Q8PJM8_PASFU|nr:O-acetyltransferase PaAT-1 [Fulvia fulva]KAK4612346.1 O-acetyltransferase PaAT-1 [Fulvia fulva]KAK4612557.1 O-acetyltransferase PaAT-1 [Fulvia fulva]UJO23599.1 O-acetyltransferase PaAT-1 [Fulvia fulva]WPV21673.1 O-acetyltransferase PaAT-1 [Fulvia fulva]WPV36059.1 O-acetyltransferase PaAT-1 [Fulvia fulva]